MKHISSFGLLAALSASIFSGDSFAGGCTSVSDATIDNLTTCPSAVAKEIWEKQSSPVKKGDLGNRVYIQDATTHGNAPSDYAHIQYLAEIKDTICLLDSYPHSQQSSGMVGPFGIRRGNACEELKGKAWSSPYVRFWKGEFLVVQQQNEIFKLSVKNPVYPIVPETARQMLASSPLRYWERVDVLASAISDLAPAAQGTLVIDVLSDPVVRSSNEATHLVSYLLTLNDERASKVIIDLVADRVVSDLIASIVFKSIYYHTLNTPEIVAEIPNWFNRYSCASYSYASLANLAGYSEEAKLALARALSRCTTSDGFYAFHKPAFYRARSLGIKSAALPIIEFLQGAKDNPQNKDMTLDFNEEYLATLAEAIVTLGYIGTDRALPVLESGTYYNNQKYPRLMTYARDAVARIRSRMQIAAIATGDASAVQWGMDLIHYRNGSMRQFQMDTLDAFKVAMTKNPALKAKIRAFLKKEVDEGFHAYDAELVAKMQSLL